MSSDMYPTRSGDTLNKMALYEICRDSLSITIQVRFCLIGEKPGTYSAIPLIKDDYANSEFWGAGDTEQAALRDCLAKIQHLSVQQLNALHS